MKVILIKLSKINFLLNKLRIYHKMKPQNIVRFLSLLAVLLLIAPFYESCRGMKKAEAEAVEVVEEAPVEEFQDSTEVQQKVEDSINIPPKEANAEQSENTNNEQVIEQEQSLLATWYGYIDDGETFNAYEFAHHLITLFEPPSSLDELYGELKKQFKEGYQTILSLIIVDFLFVLIVLVTYLIFFLSIANKNIQLLRFVKFNVLLVLLVLLLIPTLPFFETYEQIKWGYYAFLLNQLILFYYMKKRLLSQA